LRDTLLTIHILAAGTWIGANAVQFVMTPRVGDRGAAIAAAWHRAVVGLMRVLYMPAALILLVTGVLLVTAIDETSYEMSDAFVSIGFLAVIIGAGLGMRFFAPQSRLAAEAYDGGDTGAAAAIERKITIGGLVDTAVLVVTVVAMVAKWGV
jgi:hypothetical protein